MHWETRPPSNVGTQWWATFFCPGFLMVTDRLQPARVGCLSVGREGPQSPGWEQIVLVPVVTIVISHTTDTNFHSVV